MMTALEIVAVAVVIVVAHLKHKWLDPLHHAHTLTEGRHSTVFTHAMWPEVSWAQLWRMVMAIKLTDKKGT